MAKKKSQSKTAESLKTSEQSDDRSLATELGSKYDASKKMMMQRHSGWDDKESMIVLKNLDSFSDEYRSSVNDGRLSTMAWERCARVMAKIPSGQVRALTKKDKGKSALMDLALWRYIVPNANAQHPHLVKLRLWNFYSSVYGSMPMLYYWRVSDQYVGPDCQLVPIRNFYPQPGKNSIEDSDWCMVSSMVSVATLKEYAEDKTETWDTAALKEIINKAKEQGGDDKKDSSQQSFVERQNPTNQSVEKGDFAQVELITSYEAGNDGHWITFCPKYDNKIIRDIKNPHGDAKIPIILNDCFPLIDSIIGLGDFERGKTLQFAMNSLVNLYLDSMKMQLYRPIMVNTNEVVASSIKLQPGAIWRTKTTPNAAIQEMDFSPQGLNTFQSTYSFLSAALQNQNGTTTAEVSTENSGDPTFGKTPDAIKMAGERQSARDSWDSFLMENSVSQLYEAFANMLSSQEGASAIFHVFDEDVKQLKEAHDMKDVVEVFESEKAAKVSLEQSKLGDTKFRFLIDQGSTRKTDQKQALETVSQLMSVLPNLGDKLTEMGEKVDWGELIKVFIENSGLDNWDKIVVSDDQAEERKAAMSKTDEKQLEYENINFKDLPPEAQAVVVQQKYGVQSGMTPEQIKLQQNQEKIELAKQKQQVTEQQVGAKMGADEQRLGMERQRHVMGDPAPGYAEPVDPIVREMDLRSGFRQPTEEELQQLAAMQQGGIDEQS